MYNFFLDSDPDCDQSCNDDVDCDKCEEVTVEVKNDLLTSQCIRYHSNITYANKVGGWVRSNSYIFSPGGWVGNNKIYS